MIANNENISTILGLPYVPESKGEIVETIHVEPSSDKAESDYEYARRNLYDIIENGQRALDDMIDFAKQAQHPRAYEVVGTLINNLVDANQKLLHLSKQVKDIRAKENKESPDSVTNNLFVGSTAELQKLLKGD